MLATALTAFIVFIPAPPVVNVKYERIDPNLNGNGQMTTAYADPDTNTIHIPLDGVHKFVKAHEVGHLFDAQILTDGDRRYFTRLMRAPAGPWSYANTSDPRGEISPQEWFADYYGAAATGLTPANGVSPGSYAEIDDRRMRAFEKAMSRLMVRHKLRLYRP